MHSDPIPNDPGNPLVSIFVYNYDKHHLRNCLDSIFQQDVLRNFEIILIDDATTDGSWEIALEYVARYPKRITINRNRRVLGPKANLRLCEKMAHGRYCPLLTADHAFRPEYILSCIRTMIKDPLAQFDMIRRIPKIEAPPQSILERPLVSILCYNYNYGRYLRQCLESIFAQTYANFELCFSDNSSTDDSWQIALEFASRYPEKMFLTRNRKNFGPDANFANCRRNMQGKYFINFCSDDVLEPEYVQRCVNILESNPNVGLVIVNRGIIDEQGNRSEEPPFYDRSCIIPGEEQAAVYMMAGVNPSVSQIMYRNSIADARTATGALASRYYGTRILDFNISVDFDIGYIREPLVLHRIHSQSDTNQADTSMMPIFGMFVLNHQFADIAAVRNLAKVTGRLPQSLDKLAHLSTRYSIRALLAGDEHAARRYFHLAVAIKPELENDATWRRVQSYWAASPDERGALLEGFRGETNLASRSISYEPPPGSVTVGNDGRPCLQDGSAQAA